MTLNEKLGRRDFLITSAAAAAFTIVPRHVLGGPRHIAPSEKLNIAGIGIGGQGGNNLKNLETENIVALCDVDPLNYAAKTIKKYPQAKVYTDYRELLEKQKDIDAVLIATPDHTHAVITMAAMKAGKHVYCQKPLTHNIADARALAKAAKQYGVVTQMGIQGHSGDGIRLISEWIQAGLLGEVKEVDAWCSDSYYPWGHAGWSTPGSNLKRPKETPPVPNGMNWDIWLGPAKERPYHPAYHPVSWRSWLDFGNGWMGDRGVHTFDPIITPLKLGPPTSIDATTLGLTEEGHPVASVVTYMFPARKGMAPVKLTWYEGTRAPRPAELEDGRKLDKEGGAIFKGTKATLICGVYGESPRIIPESKMKALNPGQIPKKLPRVPKGQSGHEQEWVAAIKNGKKAGADFAYGAMVTEICLLGNIAKRVDARIQWNPVEMRITNIADANKYLREDYRTGWSL